MTTQSSQPTHRTLTGVVVSDRMQKTRTVLVTRSKKHSKYLKYVVVTRKFKAHDENNEYRVHDKVVIMATRPMSRDKRWTIIGKVETEKK
jgi:small subunit ribosomal protein S17